MRPRARGRRGSVERLVELAHQADRVDSRAARVTLRYNSQLRHICVGRAHASTPVVMLVADLDVRVLDADTGQLLRYLTIDPTRNYQPLGPT